MNKTVLDSALSSVLIIAQQLGFESTSLNVIVGTSQDILKRASRNGLKIEEKDAQKFALGAIRYSSIISKRKISDKSFIDLGIVRNRDELLYFSSQVEEFYNR